eukprot:Hpha_TRINITY_DN4093_c0_g1::TRINITY_DN4093_c0_g1_i1::g.63605::m.63605
MPTGARGILKLRGPGMVQQLSGSSIKCITLDVTGTLTRLRTEVASAYCAAGRWAGVAIEVERMRSGFRKAFKSALHEYPCFGHAAGLSDRGWWKLTVRRAFENCGCDFSGAQGEEQFERLFLRVYQHFATAGGYELFEDVRPFLDWCKQNDLILGVVSNNVTRIIDSTLPMLGVSQDFDFFRVSHLVGSEKPSPAIFESALAACRSLDSSIGAENVLHIGDNYTTDYCGARAFGMQALLLDRGHDHLRYQTWLTAPDYEGKTDTEHHRWVVRKLTDVPTNFIDLV